MIAPFEPDERVRTFLLDHGAERLPHPGGSLYAHLIRVATLLMTWRADPELQMAGLCHACYGTDGYDVQLLAPEGRSELRAVIGARAESLVYLYASCDRSVVYPALTRPGPVSFRDRFTGRTHTPAAADIRAFTELTAANELDVIQNNPALAAQHGPALRTLFDAAGTRLSEQAVDAWRHTLDATAAAAVDDPADPPTSPVIIDSVDHLVLTVADLEQTATFYQRVLGMRPVTFGAGRRALEFGSSKINLHETGHEFRPHAARPSPGSADLCLVTSTAIDSVIAHLRALRVPVEEGPVRRTGARGPITSIYIRDPDQNLIEIASYDYTSP